MYLLTLTATNLKARDSTAFLYRNLAAKIYNGSDEVPPLYKNGQHRQQIEALMDRCFLVEGFAGRGDQYDFKMKKKPLKVYDLMAQDQSTYEFNKYLMSNYCSDRVDHSQFEKQPQE